MAETATVRVLFLGDAGGALRSTNLLSRSFSGLGRTAKLAGVAIVGGIVTGMASATSAAIDFDRAMRNVNSIAKLSEGAFQSLSKEVLAMAKESGQAPKTLAEGLYDIVSSGFEAADAIKILRVSAKAATAGMTDTATATKAINAALNAYHLNASEASDVSDVLFQTVNKGVLTFEELAQNMGDMVPIAAPLGVSLEEVGAAIATITLQGVPAAEAATRVKNVMLQLARPSENLAELLEEQGFQSGEAAIKAEGFVGVLELLDEATRGNVTRTSALTPEIRALMGVVGLTGKNLKTYKGNLDSMSEATAGAGATAEAFAEQSKSIGVQWDKAKAKLTAAGISLAQSWFPAVAGAIDKASEFAGWLERLAKQKDIDAKVKFTVAGLGSLKGQLGEILLGSPGRRVRVPIEAGRFEWQIQGESRGLVDQMFGFLESSFSERAMFGSAGKRVRVPVEGGRFEWEIVGAREGWLNALERELEGGIEDIDFSRVGRVLATTGGGLIQVAGVLAVALAQLISKAIRDINWGQVGSELAAGMAKTIPGVFEGLGAEGGKIAEDKLGRNWGQRVSAGFKDAVDLTPVLGTTVSVWETIASVVEEESQAAVTDIDKISAAVLRIPDRHHTTITSNIPAAISQVERYRFALSRIPSQLFQRLTLIEERRPFGGGPQRQFGGPVSMGTPYWVGERGERELFTPGRSGRITPESQLGMGGGPITIQLSPEATIALMRGEAVKATPQIERETGRRASRLARTYSG